LRNAFSTFDKNDDGFISKQELSEGMSSLGHIITENELDDIIKAVDSDGKCKLGLNTHLKRLDKRIFLFIYSF